MYTRGQGDAQIVLYRLPVPDERFIAARRTVQMMLRDGGYIYNVWSVFTYPLTRGLPAYKAQTCSEFTAGILRIAGLRLDRPDCRYHPEDFTHLLGREPPSGRGPGIPAPAQSAPDCRLQPAHPGLCRRPKPV